MTGFCIEIPDSGDRTMAKKSAKTLPDGVAEKPERTIPRPVQAMLWGRAAWGIWWTWDARLTTALLLWLLYVSYLLLRQFSSGGAMLPGNGQTGLLSAVLGVFAAIDIPICFMSIRWWRTQHPAPVFGGGDGSGIDRSMLPAVLWNMAAWAMWGFFLLAWRYALERRRQHIAAARALAFLSSDAYTGVPATAVTEAV